MSNSLRRLAHNNEFLSFSGNIIYTLLGFASFLLLTRTYPAGVFGGWVLYVTAATLMEMLRFGITKYAIIRHLSGAEAAERKMLLGSHWLVSFSATGLLVLLVLTIRQIFPMQTEQSGYDFFFKWYPLLALANLPFNNTLSIWQAEQKFKHILILRTLNISSFVAFLAWNRYVQSFPIERVIEVHLLINFVSSLTCLIMRWDGLNYLWQASAAGVRQILHFGKFSTGTTMGMNLLKTTDTIIIGISPALGAAGVAFYAIPLKFMELFEIALRSSAATSFPRMSKIAIQHSHSQVKKLFDSYTGVLSILFVPVIVTGILFAPALAIWLAGHEYRDASLLLGIFFVSAIFLPADRFSGIALDSINKPALHFSKVLVQNILSVTGCLILLLVSYQASGLQPIQLLALFALISVVVNLTGAILGMIFLTTVFKVCFTDIFRCGFSELNAAINRIRTKKTKIQ